MFTSWCCARICLRHSRQKATRKKRRARRKTPTAPRIPPRTIAISATRTKRKTRTKIKTKSRTRKRTRSQSRSRSISTTSVSGFSLFRFLPKITWRSLAGKAGELFIVELPPAPDSEGPPNLVLSKFDLSKRKTDQLIAGIQDAPVSFNGEKYLYQQGEKWFIATTAQAAKPGEGELKIDAMEVWVDPHAEWKQMYHEIWRIERDFLYDPHFHGVNLQALSREYEPYLDRIATRDDLNYLFQQMLSEINVGHMFVGGGNIPEVQPLQVGLLGADYKIENGRYRFARVYNGENWNPQLHAPLTQPGVNVVAGEYLLAVNGRDVAAELKMCTAIFRKPLESRLF